MSKSIMQDSKYCYLTGVENVPLECHHIYGGPLRKISDKNGFFVWLTPEVHRNGKRAVHRDYQTSQLLKRVCQRKYEETHSRAEFMKLIGRNYLD